MDTGIPYERLRDTFRWCIPERFNIANAICARHARHMPEAPALICADDSGRTTAFTYGDLDALSSRLANALAARGITRGSIVAVNLTQCVEFVLTLIAVTRIGGIFLPLAALFGQDALRYRLADSGARILVTNADGFERCRDLLPDLADLRHVFVAGDRSNRHEHNFWRLVDDGAEGRAICDTDAEAPGLMLYTSGTTGQPKGVLHAHRMILASTAGMSYAHDLFPQTGDRMWTPADWAWAGGLNALLTAMIHGKAIVATPPAKFDPERILDLIQRLGIRNAFIPPTALRLMRALPLDKIAACRPRSLMSGGEALGTDMIEWGREAFGVTISEGFGLSEAFIPIGNCPSLFAVRSGSMGRALPGHELAVLDDAGAPVSDGTRGQLALRRPNPLLFLEYWRQPQATAAKFLGDWCLFGDLVTRDTDGYIWFHGRNDDVIKSSGYRIGPQEVEDCLVQHPAVRHAGVIGTPDIIRGEAVTAFLVLRDGHRGNAVLAEEIRTFVRRKLAAHEYPRLIYFIDEMPLTVTGKIRRLDLRAMAAKLQ